MFWIGAVLALSVLIIVHESGHYVVAKWCKMRVDRFSLGFGPTLLGWRRNETLFQLAPIPFGGFVEIRGMNIAEDVDPDDPYAYPNRPAWQRFLTIFAGPATNFLFAIVLAFVLFSTAGIRTGVELYSISEVQPEFDAHGKLQPGDRILSISQVGSAEAPPLGYPGYSITELVQASGGTQLEVLIQRDGQRHTYTIQPKLESVADESDETDGSEPSEDPDQAGEQAPRRYLLGIIFNTEYERIQVSLIEAAGYALYYPVDETIRYLGLLSRIFKGKAEGELNGPVKIARFVKQALEVGWIATLNLLMLLNVLLGIVNLFPLPALDGGRLVFLTYEMATRRRANPKVEASVHMVGIMVLLLVLVVVTVKECAELI